MDFLYNFSNLSIMFSFIFIIGLLLTILHFIARSVPFLRPRPETFDFAMRMQIPVFSMCGLLLAFSLVNVQGNLKRVDALVTAEAAQLNNLDRLLSRFGDPQAQALRVDLQAYVRSIVTDEWLTMRQGAGSEATRHLFTPVARGVVLLVPQPGRQMQVFADMLKKIDDITEAREARLESAQIALPSEYWHAVGLIILILASLMSLVEITGFRAVAMGLQLSSLAIILALVFITDRPYLGETSIGPDAFQHVLKLMLERTS